MPDDATPSGTQPLAGANLRDRCLARFPWMIYVLPLAVFMLVGIFEPLPPTVAKPDAWQLPYSAYPLVYLAKIVATLLALAVVWPGVRAFPLRVSAWGLLVGVVGAVLWIGLSGSLASLGLWTEPLEDQLLGPLGLKKLLGVGARSAFNPLEQLADRPLWAYGFLAIRFVGLVAVVPVMEELFLRGFLMRFFVSPKWWDVPFGTVNLTAVIVGTVVPMLMHPGELLAAGVWFSLVTWLMVRTRSFWDCVLAHAVTNLLLGIYVVSAGDWPLM